MAATWPANARSGRLTRSWPTPHARGGPLGVRVKQSAGARSATRCGPERGRRRSRAPAPEWNGWRADRAAGRARRRPRCLGARPAAGRRLMERRGPPDAAMSTGPRRCVHASPGDRAQPGVPHRTSVLNTSTPEIPPATARDSPTVVRPRAERTRVSGISPWTLRVRPPVGAERGSRRCYRRVRPPVGAPGHVQGIALCHRDRVALPARGELGLTQTVEPSNLGDCGCRAYWFLCASSSYGRAVSWMSTWAHPRGSGWR